MAYFWVEDIFGLFSKVEGYFVDFPRENGEMQNFRLYFIKVSK